MKRLIGLLAGLSLLASSAYAGTVSGLDGTLDAAMVGRFIAACPSSQVANYVAGATATALFNNLNQLCTSGGGGGGAVTNAGTFAVQPTTIAQAPGNMPTTQVTLSTTATQVLAARTARQLYIVTQISTTSDIYCGPTSAVTVSNGQIIPATKGANLSLSNGSAVWCIAVSGTPIVSTLESY